METIHPPSWSSFLQELILCDPVGVLCEMQLNKLHTPSSRVKKYERLRQLLLVCHGGWKAERRPPVCCKLHPYIFVQNKTGLMFQAAVSCFESKCSAKMHLEVVLVRSIKGFMIKDYAEFGQILHSALLPSLDMSLWQYQWPRSWDKRPLLSPRKYHKAWFRKRPRL